MDIVKILEKKREIEKELKNLGVSNTQIYEIFKDPKMWFFYYMERFEKGKTVATVPPENVGAVFDIVRRLIENPLPSI